MAGVLIYCEVKDGKLKKASREALTIGRKLAEKTGGELSAFVAGGSAASTAPEAGRYGAKKLYAAASGALDAYTAFTLRARLALPGARRKSQPS